MAGKGSHEVNVDERKIIEKCLSEKMKTGKIADILSRSHSCIKQEIKKNGGRAKYSADRSQHEYELRQEAKKIKIRKELTEEQENILLKGIEEEWSVNRISLAIDINHTTVAAIIRRRGISLKKKNYTHFVERLSALEYQIDIILETLEEMKKR